MSGMFGSIKDITIKGEIEYVLQQPITKMDEAMQSFCDATEQLRKTLYKYSGSNQGKQFKRTWNSITEFSTKLYNACVDMNQLQNEVTHLGKQTGDYEGVYVSLRKRDLYVRVASYNVNDRVVYFRLPEMQEVVSAISSYLEKEEATIRTLKSKAAEINNYWSDSQYDKFYSAVEEICVTITKGCSSLREYNDYLKGKIINLTS